MTSLPSTRIGTRSARQAIEAVLTQASNPLPGRELTRRVLEDGLWQTAEKTPEDTINAQLATDILRHGAASRFQRTGKGVFALRAWGLPAYDVPVRPARTDPSAAAPASGPAMPSSSRSDQAATISPAARPPTPRGMSFTNAENYVLERSALQSEN